MAGNLLHLIRDAERKAEKLVQDAEQESKALISKARETAKVMIEETERKRTTGTEKNKGDIQNEVDKQKTELLQLYKNKEDAFKEKVATNRQKGIDYVVESILKI
jgi:vacuolar-type H+-ATPase subunit H